MVDWRLTSSVFLGTAPLLFVLIWNLVEVKSLKAEMKTEFLLIRKELGEIKETLASVRERLATLEERDRGKNPIFKN